MLYADLVPDHKTGARQCRSPKYPRSLALLYPPTGPVTVTVNGKAADVLAAVGYPGSADGYQVNFRMPSGAAKGSAIIQVSAAWVARNARQHFGPVNRFRTPGRISMSE